MKSIYILSGLGADKRVLQFLDFSGFKLIFIEWTKPDGKESINEYAQHLIQQIKEPRPVLIGLSFGGIVAVEIAKLIETEKIILISSAKKRQDIPFYYRLAGKLQLHKILPAKFLKTPNVLSYWFFGITSKRDKKILGEILKETDPQFLKWAINKIVSWQNETVHKNLTHIHGTADRILPIRFINCDAKIQQGGHLMIMNKPEEVMKLVRKYL